MTRPIMPQHHRFVKAVARALRGPCGVKCGSRLLVAVSGGADSVALLRGLHALAPRRSWQLQLTIAHVQHHLREDAEADAQFVQKLAGDLSLSFVRADLDAAALTGRGNVEANARRARYAAFRELAEQTGSTLIATAHHGDDQLETMLMRLLRGASVHGLAAMRPRRRLAEPGDAYLIRPMLALDRAAVLDFLSDLQQSWREDHTNADLTRWRARLRREVLPVLRALRPDAARKASQTARHLHKVADWLQTCAAQAEGELIKCVDDGMQIDRDELGKLPPPVRETLLRRAMLRCGARPDKLATHTLHPLLRAIDDQQGGRRTFTFGHNIMVTITRTSIDVTSPK